MTADTGTHEHDTALATAQHAPRLHVPRLVRAAHVMDQVHGAGVLGRFNAAVAVRITKVVWTMY